MLKRVLAVFTKRLKNLRMAEVTATRSEVRLEKRPLEEDDETEPFVKKSKSELEVPPIGQVRLDKKRKVALLLAYRGAGYYGIQFQKGDKFKTIESELIKALLQAGAIPQGHADMLQLVC